MNHTINAASIAANRNTQHIDPTRCAGSHHPTDQPGIHHCPTCGQNVLAVKRWGTPTPILNTHSIPPRSTP